MSKNKPKKSKDNDAEYVLVYSTDPKPEELCLNCRRTLSSCVCDVNVISKLRPAIHFEKKGRAGKSVTIVSKLPANEKLLKKLLSHLKRTLGSSGTFYISEGQGIIEIQGQQNEKILKIIESF